MEKRDLLHLAELLNQFIFEYGTEISGESDYSEPEKIDCKEIIEKINELTKEKVN